MRLKDKTALVTGAASGFGLAIARRFAAEGARLALLDIDEKGARRAAQEIGDSALPLGGDVSVGDEVRRAVESAVAAFGDLDIVVNNAGWSHVNRPALDIDEEDFKKVYAVNVHSIFHMTKAIVPHWRRRARGGVMINIGSTGGIRPRPGLSWYNSTKGAVHAMTKALAVDFAEDRIRVCALAPVMSPTALIENFMGLPDTPENRARFESTIPFGRFSRPEEIAAAALYLASDEAEFLTGVILEVDGGRCI